MKSILQFKLLTYKTSEKLDMTKSFSIYIQSLHVFYIYMKISILFFLLQFAPFFPFLQHDIKVQKNKDYVIHSSYFKFADKSNHFTKASTAINAWYYMAILRILKSKRFKKSFKHNLQNKNYISVQFKTIFI